MNLSWKSSLSRDKKIVSVKSCKLKVQTHLIKLKTETMRQVTELDFSGKTIFCGIDVHKLSWSVCLSMEDRILKRFSQPPTIEALETTLKRRYPGAEYKAVYEAGFCGFYPQRKKASRGIDCIVVNAADIPTMDKEKKTKIRPC